MKARAGARAKYRVPGPRATESDLFGWADEVRGQLRKVKPATSESYRRMTQGMAKRSAQEGRRLIDIALDTRSPRSWFARRAALLHTLASDLAACANPDAQSLRVYVEEFRQINESGLPGEGRRRRHSKRRDIDLVAMGDNWRERLIDALGPKWRQSMTVMAAVGCRPSEFGRGITVDKTPDGDIVVTVTGAKVKSNAGHDQRTFAIPKGNRWYGRLAELFDSKVAVVLPASPASLTSTIRSKAEQLWPRRRQSITAYCFRHASATEWKHAGYDRAEVALMLGHQTTEMQKYYGGRRIGADRISPDTKIRVDATQSQALRIKAAISRSPSRVAKKLAALGI